MTTKKTRISSKAFGSSNAVLDKPSTVARAEITAGIKLTRGKQLVEHNPNLLIPDPNNPRPGEIIDDEWLKKYLLIGTEDCLCKFEESTKEYYIPKFDELNTEIPRSIQEDYGFLRELAYSIRNDGLIEPIEIFLADKKNDPEYFAQSELDYGYVVLEGHQRRLAAILAGVSAVTCIEIIDETMLSRLKVKNRKLRRQLSENNLRKGLSVGQNFKIVCSFLNEKTDNINITAKELSSIIGLNEDISGALKKLAISKESFPKSMINLIEYSLVSYKWIRTWISKPFFEIQEEADRLLLNKPPVAREEKKVIKPRGRNAGAVKRSAIFKVDKEQDSMILQNYLFQKIPELSETLNTGSSFNNLENILNRLMELARTSNPTRVEK